MTELQYPIRGVRWRGGREEYYYLQEHNGMRLGDIVREEHGEQEGELVTIVHIVGRDEPTDFIGVIRVPDGGGENGYATEYGDILGISGYDRSTYGCNFSYITSLYNGSCINCVSRCKGEERCAFYREEVE